MLRVLGAQLRGENVKSYCLNECVYSAAANFMSSLSCSILLSRETSNYSESDSHTFSLLLCHFQVQISTMKMWLKDHNAPHQLWGACPPFWHLLSNLEGRRSSNFDRLNQGWLGAWSYSLDFLLQPGLVRHLLHNDCPLLLHLQVILEQLAAANLATEVQLLKPRAVPELPCTRQPRQLLHRLL